MQHSKRLFAAVKVVPEESFLQIYNTLKEALKNDRIKWVEPGNIHLTMKFYGETENDRIPDIIQTLKSCAEKSAPFHFDLRGTGVFGSRYKPRVIWLGTENNDEFVRLGTSILDASEKIGFEKDRQNFVPHLTIGRIKYINDRDHFQSVIREFRDQFIQKVSVEKFYLYESILRRTGPEYVVVESFDLG